MKPLLMGLCRRLPCQPLTYFLLCGSHGCGVNFNFIQLYLQGKLFYKWLNSFLGLLAILRLFFSSFKPWLNRHSSAENVHSEQEGA